jgi:hypothetical protein
MLNAVLTSREEREKAPAAFFFPFFDSCERKRISLSVSSRIALDQEFIHCLFPF